MAATRPRRVYLDTSAYVHLLLDEEGSLDVRDAIGTAEVLSSVLLLLETRRTLVRLARDHVMTKEHYKIAMERVTSDGERFVLRDLTLDLCDAHPLPAVATPRSLDLVHLRTARWFHRVEPIDRFVTMDDAQRDAARELGLPV
jgi:predicted nucleic acid-binding protein